MNVGITDCARYENYERWFLDAPVKVYVIRLSYKLNNLDDVKQCQGIVLSGGGRRRPLPIQARRSSQSFGTDRHRRETRTSSNGE